MGKGFDDQRLERIGAFCDRYVEQGRLACAQVQVAHEGKVAYRHTVGMADVDAERPLGDDAVYRIYSMTKPVTSVALMQLYEQGLVLLENPVARFIPEFANATVWAGGTAADPQVHPAANTMTVRDVLTHTSGLTYGFFHAHPLDELYREDDLGNFVVPDITLEQAMRLLATKPLLFEPGTKWNYSMSTDVCGRLVEVISGLSLDEYLAQHVFGPLGMRETGFCVDPANVGRVPTTYQKGEAGLTPVPDLEAVPTTPPKFLSGGGGLFSTTDDYQRFCDMLLGGGELDGVRVIGRKTLEYMTLNHLPGGLTLNDLGQSTFSETAMEGMGFGLGFSVVVDPAANGAITSVGEFAWGGAASTAFFIDPVERISAVFMTQFMPSNHYPLRRQLKSTVYGALR